MDYTKSSGYVVDAQGRRQFADRNEASGVQGTCITEDFLNAIQNEIINIILWGGLTPNAGDQSQAAKAIAAWVNARPRGMETFGASGTFTVPAGVFSVEYELWGGGGAAGGSVGAGGAGAGGGAGAYARGVMPVTPGQEINVIIGKGGAGVKGDNGVNGGSSFINSDIKAVGGSYGTAGINAASLGWGVGGKASGGAINIDGYPGQGAPTLTSTTAMSGQGGSSFGGGASFSIAEKGDGAGGTYPGGGGSGAVGDGYTGGAGSDGMCIFRW